MRLEAIHAHLRKQPFIPFRVFLSNGATHEVRHPEMMWVSRIEVGIALEPTSGPALGEDDIPYRFAYCDPVHIVKLEPINGQPSKERKTKRK